MQEVSKIKFVVTHKAQVEKSLGKAFGDRRVIGKYDGTGDYEARVLEDGVVLYWKEGQEPKAIPRVIAGPPLKPGDYV